MGSDPWAAYESMWSDGTAQRPRDEIPLAERRLLALGELRSEVNSGGFESYFSYAYGDELPTLLTVLTDLGLNTLQSLVADAASVFGSPYPTETTTRVDFMMEHEDDEGLFGAYDARYFALEGSSDLDAAQARLASTLEGRD